MHFSRFALIYPRIHAQNDALDGFIEKYKSDKAFTYAFLSKDLFEVVSKADIEDKDWKKLHNVVKNIGSLRILAADSVQDGLSLYKEALALAEGDRALVVLLEDILLEEQDGVDEITQLLREQKAGSGKASKTSSKVG